LQGFLKSGRRCGKEDVCLEVDRCCQHLHAENIKFVTATKLPDQRGKFTKADQPDVVWKFQHCSDRTLACPEGERLERCRKDASVVARAQDCLAEADVPIAGGEHLGVRARWRAAPQEGSQELVVD